MENRYNNVVLVQLMVIGQNGWLCLCSKNGKTIGGIYQLPFLVVGVTKLIRKVGIIYEDSSLNFCKA